MSSASVPRTGIARVDLRAKWAVSCRRQRDGPVLLVFRGCLVRERVDAAAQAAQQVPVDLAGVGPAAGQPDQRLGPVKRPAVGDVVGQLVLAVGLGVGAALVEGVAERQVQARPGALVGRVPGDPGPRPPSRRPRRSPAPRGRRRGRHGRPRRRAGHGRRRARAPRCGRGGWGRGRPCVPARPASGTRAGAGNGAAPDWFPAARSRRLDGCRG